jgi:phage terminase large subunit
MMRENRKQVTIKSNKVYRDFYGDKTEIIFVYGGGGSGKSVAIAQKIILRVIKERPHKPHKFLCLRKVQKDLDDSVVAELQDVINDLEVSHEFVLNKTRKTFIHTPTGNQILCRGLDEPERIKSIKGISSMWIEEASEFSQDEFEQLLIRIRGYREKYVQWICSFNPIDENLWQRKYIEDNRNNPNFKFIWTTYKDNRFLSKRDKERLEGLKLTNPLFYDIYCLGLWGVVDKSGKFLFSFNADKQVNKGLEINPNLPIWFSFDFNIDPMTVTVGQLVNTRKLVALKSIQLNNSDIYAMTDRLKADYPGFHWQVTGDASGHNRTGAVRGKTSYWRVIREELGLKDNQIHVRSQNIGLIESRVLCNAVNQTVEVLLDEEGCIPLINDCKFAKVDEKGVLIKDREKQKNDFLDGFRYLIDINFHDFLSNFKKYKKT